MVLSRTAADRPHRASMASRREILGAIAALPALGIWAAPSRAQAAPNLAALAREKGLFFGAAVSSDDLVASPDYEQLLIEQCEVWTPEWQFNWAELHGTPDALTFEGADELVAVAVANGKRMRGHPFLWHEQLPDWAAELGAPEDWVNQVEPYLAAKAAHFEGIVFQWDVVNEPVEPEDGQRGGLRNTPFYRMLGGDYIQRTLEIAHENAPSARLYLNEYGICYDEGWQQNRRDAILGLIEDLLEKGAPLHGLGIQGHLDIRHDFSERKFARFLDEVAQFGLEITVTELDVLEGDGNSNSAEQRFRRAADEVRKVMSVALDQPATKGIVTWSLSDRFSWLRYIRNIADNHGLPYDEDLRPAPMHAALAELFANAPAR
jgi:endo-1,4-beta-xylanase